jgi:hypothetical protein
LICSVIRLLLWDISANQRATISASVTPSLSCAFSSATPAVGQPADARHSEIKRRTRFAHQDGIAASQHELTLFSLHVKHLSRAIAIVTQNSRASRQARLLPYPFRGTSRFDPRQHRCRGSPQQWLGEENLVGCGLLHHFDAKISPMMSIPVNPRFEGTREAPSGFVSVAPGGPLNRSLR